MGNVCGDEKYEQNWKECNRDAKGPNVKKNGIAF